MAAMITMANNDGARSALVLVALAGLLLAAPAMLHSQSAAGMQAKPLDVAATCVAMGGTPEAAGACFMPLSGATITCEDAGPCVGHVPAAGRPDTVTVALRLR
jgi:hypothetical protein